MSSSDNTIDKLQWAVAVGAIIDTFRVAVPSVHKDSVITEIARVAEKFSSLTQREMNFQCYLNATVGYYRTIEAYRQWLLAVPKNIRQIFEDCCLSMRC